ADALAVAWKEARIAIRHQADVEKGVIRSSGVLYDDPSGAAKRLAPIEAAVDRVSAALHDEARAAYALESQRLNTPPTFEPPMTPEEKDAASLIVECVNGSTPSGCASAPGAGRGGGGGRGGGPSAVPQHMGAE